MDRMHAFEAATLTSDGNHVRYSGAPITAKKSLLYSLGATFRAVGPLQQRTSPAEIGGTAGRIYSGRCAAKEHPVEIGTTDVPLRSRTAPIDDPTQL